MMNRRFHAGWRAAGLAALLLPASAGCGSGVGEVPSGQQARAALEAALTAWTRGAKPGTLPGSDPPVVVHDTPWAQGQSLASFQILREEEGSAAEKRFTVRLTLAKPDRTAEVQYHVLGVGPVMVFRDEDFYRNINMENGPGVARPSGRTRRPG
ncbi:MAG: hypothetical protein U0835_00910 [Isosphaeraceae bacterium]